MILVAGYIQSITLGLFPGGYLTWVLLIDINSDFGSQTQWECPLQNGFGVQHKCLRCECTTSPLWKAAGISAPPAMAPLVCLGWWLVMEMPKYKLQEAGELAQQLKYRLWNFTLGVVGGEFYDTFYSLKVFSKHRKWVYLAFAILTPGIKQTLFRTSLLA